MEQDLFGEIRKQNAPLAERLRPQSWEQVFGQEKLTSPNGILWRLTEKNRLPSLIFWGPPGSGKTTLARIIAEKISAHFTTLSAVQSGVADLKEEVRQAQNRTLNGTRTILFLDEIHRWNKSQQDAMLPHIEAGTITLIGATTENPSFAINSALLSRCEVIILESLNDEALEKILAQALEKITLKLTPKAKKYLVESSNGDARTLLNRLEILENSKNAKKALTDKQVAEILNHKMLRYDKSGEEHYNLISALHKSMRGSDPDASLYYAMRMLESGENPLYLLRRLVRFAVEDIGNADPSAQAVALRAKETYEFLGSPEGDLAIAQLAIYLACSPKSNSVYMAFNKVKKDINQTGNLEIPKKLRNAPTKLMEKIGYGENYKYAHDFKNAIVKGEVYLPEELKNKKYYEPTDRGLEAQIKKRLEDWRKK